MKEGVECLHKRGVASWPEIRGAWEGMTPPLISMKVWIVPPNQKIIKRKTENGYSKETSLIAKQKISDVFSFISINWKIKYS